MSPKWQYYKQQATDPVRNPIAAEFFSTEAVGDVAQALVREGVQNTLDARLRQGNGSRVQARVRIYVSGPTGALPEARVRHWFDGIWPHTGAPGNGLRDQPEGPEPCPFLVFEDFGTFGLTGDPEAHVVTAGTANHFLNFFRAEGHSDKSGEDRGSWGVGKTVFPRASRMSSFLGLTVRSDDRRQLLFGRSILKYHSVGGTAYKSDGYFGRPRDDGFMLPIEEAGEIDRFRKDFHLKRRDESGLSVVVPWYEVNNEDGITGEKVY